MRRIAYVPARSGSKGVPKKNVRPLCGKPLLGWVVEAALKTGLFDRVMVSTDSEEFAEIARRCGAWVPFLRDPAVAGDKTSTIETVCSDKRRLEARGEAFDIFCLLQPTAPLCRAADIAGAVALAERTHEGVVSVKRAETRLSLLRTLGTDGRLVPLTNSHLVLRRQDEGGVYEINGALYVNSWHELVPTLKLAYNPQAYVMDAESSVDIDTEDDFALVERILRSRNG